jgi:DMSO/TMAO reductase YedYZ molybdopterin-dependent catalytic subunit
MPSRRLFIASSLAAVGLGLDGCARVTNALNDNGAIRNVLGSAQSLNDAVIGSRGHVRTYDDSAIDRDFRTNGFSTPSSSDYTKMVSENFASYTLAIDGAVEKAERLTIRELRALVSIDEATRHDCVEGWSAIGRWRGVPLKNVLAMVRPKPEARFVVFHCFDVADDGTPYYESLDLSQASHPQTQLALDLNGKPLDADHGAPVRLRVPTQLGYKSAKWVSRIEVVPKLAGIYGGTGGYWEDNGYEWFAGI